jgi:hypothetical protein
MFTVTDAHYMYSGPVSLACLRQVPCFPCCLYNSVVHFYMSPIHHIAHLQPLFQFLTTPECNYYILHAQLVLPSSLFDNVTFRHVAFLAFPFEQHSQEIFEGYLFSYI